MQIKRKFCTQFTLTDFSAKLNGIYDEKNKKTQEKNRKQPGGKRKYKYTYTQKN